MSMGFPHSSVGKGSACNTGDPSSIHGLGRSAGEGIGYPFQYSWASLLAQLVKNLPAMQETWVWSWGWVDPLVKEKATHSSILAWRIPWTVHRVTKSWTRRSNFHFSFLCPWKVLNEQSIITFTEVCFPFIKVNSDIEGSHIISYNPGFTWVSWPLLFLHTWKCL